jgi:type I restriction enzyme S subunit
MKFVELEKVCKIKNGFAFKSTEFRNQGVPLLRISNFDDGNVFINDKTVFVDEEYLVKKKDFLVEKGDVLIALSGATTGKYGVYSFDYPSLLNQRIGLLKSGVSEKLISKYFYFYLSILRKEILRKAGGAAQPNISTKAIGEFKIPLPKLETQKKIAAILDEADKIRQLNKQLIAKYDALTQSLFLEMFGKLDENIIELGEVIKLIGGGTPSKDKEEYWSGNIPWASVKDLKSDRLSKTVDKITIEGVNNSATKIIPKGSLIVATRMAVGRATICEMDVAINQDLKAIKIIENVNVVYLQSLFKSKEKYFDSVSSGATVKGIKIEHITRLKIPIPSIEFQNQFAERVQIIENQKQQAQEALQKSEDLFNSLLQKAFKGELVKE